MIQIVRFDSLVPAPWKNHGGLTREVFRMPASGEPFRWRLSIAQIERSGPFSDFSGYDRFIVLLSGRGTRLRFSEGKPVVLREVADWVKFDGGISTHGELIDGPCIDLNLMTSKTMREVDVGVCALDEPLSLSVRQNSWKLLVPIDGPVSIDTSAPSGPQGPTQCAVGRWDAALVSTSESACELRVAMLDRAGLPTWLFVATLRDQKVAN